jgi:anaerobic magnesium-protoporphyrin IX monomethyl ester cyclase
VRTHNHRVEAFKPRRVLLMRPAWEPLTSPSENTYNRTWPPLSSLYVATGLRERGVDASVVDLQALRRTAAQAVSGIGAQDMVFLSTADVDRWQCPNVEMEPIDRLAAAVRAAGAPFFLTGTHGAVAPEKLLRRTGAVGVIHGEPEEAALALATGVPPESIPGLLLRDGADGLLDTGPAPSVDLRRLPAPDYSLVDLDLYGYEILGRRFALFEGSRGCPFPCTFCSRVLQGRAVRRKDPGQLMAEVERAVRRDGVESAYLIDLEFHLGGATSRGFCDAMAESRIPLRWCCELRPREVGDGLLDAMAAGGCRLVHCGIESGSQERLEVLDKVGRLEEMVDGVHRILARGMEVLCFFILGFPGESEAEIEKTVRLALDLSPTYASFHLFTPYPGTEYAVAVGDGAHFVPPSHPDALPFDRLSRLRRAAYLRFYLRPRYVLSRLGRRDYGSLLRQARLLVSQAVS